MVIALFPRVMGFKVEDVWRRTPREMVRCTARLSRPLLPKELERIETLLKTPVHGLEVVHECRRDGVETWKSRLIDALSGTRRSADGRIAAVAGARRPRRPQPDPSAPHPAA